MGLLQLFLTHVPSASPFKKTLLSLPLEICRAVTIPTLLFGMLFSLSLAVTFKEEQKLSEDEGDNRWKSMFT